MIPGADVLCSGFPMFCSPPAQPGLLENLLNILNVHSKTTMTIASLIIITIFSAVAYHSIANRYPKLLIDKYSFLNKENTVAVPRKQHHGGGFKSVGCQTVVGCDNMKCSMASDELRIHRAGMHTISVGTLHKAIDDFSLMLRYWPTKPQQSGGESRDGPSAANAPAPLTPVLRDDAGPPGPSRTAEPRTPVLRDDAGPPGPVRSTHSAESHTPVRRDDAGPPGPSRSTHSAALQQQQP